MKHGTGGYRSVEPTPLWHRFAACRPEYADRPLDQWVDQAMRNREHHGIWGSTSERERRRTRRQIRLTRPA